MQNSIEEDIKILKSIIKINNDYLKGVENQTINQKEIKALEHILQDYKRVLKENEILNEEKEQAWEEWNNLEQGSYETEQNLKQQIKELQKENEELKEYITIAPNLDEMTAIKYRNIRQDAYIQGRAEEQQRAEQIIYKNYISKQKIKDKIKELERFIYRGKNAPQDFLQYRVKAKIQGYKELLEESEE